MAAADASTASQELIGSADEEASLPRGAPKASEKRRAQNRAAQKTYREKRKRRLQELERLASSAGLISTSSASESPPDSNHSPDPQPLPIPSTLDISQTILSDTTLDSTDLFNTNDLLTQTLTPDSISNSLSNSLTTTFWNPIQPTEWDAAANGLSSFIDFPDPLPFTTTTTSVITSSSDSDSTGSDGSRSPSKADYYAATMRGFLDGSYKAPTVADPYANTLRLHQTTVCWAFYQNVLHIGLDETVCADDAVSPFYRPEAARCAENDALLQSVQSTFACIKRDLRPTRIQITTPHPGYVDVLPFPSVRSRIIELLANDPPLFDEDEFWRDIEAGGLMCWGSIAVRRGTRSTAGGAPWDSRSWEAKTWFLAKWSFIVGGEDGELGRASEWWREMRGVGQGFSF
jgi:Domain of unknown function (DUF3425)